MTEKCCSDCEHIKVIISQMGNYYCPKKEVYIDYEFYCDCDDFKRGNETLLEKEKKVW